jgi:hypothetical protein
MRVFDFFVCTSAFFKKKFDLFDEEQVLKYGLFLYGYLDLQSTEDIAGDTRADICSHLRSSTILLGALSDQSMPRTTVKKFVRI